MKTLGLFFLGIFLAFQYVNVYASGAGLSQAERLRDYEQLVANIRTSYGPFNYKIEHQIVDIEAHISDFRSKVARDQSNREFYYLMVEFVAGFHDGHFGISLPSDHAKSVGFTSDLVQNKVLITSIDRNRLSQAEFPFAVGDEVLAVDGVAIREVLQDFKKYLGSGYDRTEERMAAWLIPARAARRVPVPTSDTVEFEIRRGESLLNDKVTLTWQETGTPLDESETFFKDSKSISGVQTPHWLTLSNRQTFEGFSQEYLDRQFMCSGESRIERPRDAVVIIEKPFVAYYFPTERGNIGYLRIPHYSWVKDFTRRNEDDGEYERAVFLQYEHAIQVLEEKTVGLIIDQDHNCGGSVEFLERMVGLFMNRPYAPQRFRLRASKETYVEVKAWQKALPENSIPWFAVDKILELVRSAWQAGGFLTDYTALSSYSELAPNPIHYTHPILMLIDELSGSGGDAFPSLLQGYGRVKLLGVRTSGLGGHVVEQPNLFNSQLQLRMTRSLFYRPDGVAVENNGAVPDIPYEIERSDVMYGYRGYFEFAVTNLVKML